MRGMAALVQRMRERRLVQWVVAYLAAAWLLLQVLDLLAGFFEWPTIVGRVATVLLGAGFLAALVAAWYHGERGEQKVTTMEIGMLAGILAIGAAAVTFVGGGTGERPAEARASPSATAAEQPPSPRPASIAVLPFVNMSSDPEQEYFSDGMTEEILNALAGVRGLHVAARTSSFSFKGRNVPVDEIARRLRVAHLLEGSVRKADERLRITAQLVRADDGYHLWSQSYDRDLTDVFAIQQEIASAIASALEARIGDAAGGVAERAGTRSVEAHDLYLRGRHLASRRTEASFLRAIELFRQALEKDPQYARAYVGLASTYGGMADAYLAPHAVYPKARDAVLRAIALDSTSAESHAALGAHVLWYDWDFPAADRALRRAAELNPNVVQGPYYRGFYECTVGDPAAGVTALDRARALDPLEPGLVHWQQFCLFQARRYDEAIASQERLLDLDATFFYLDSFAAAALREKGLYDRAIAEYQRVARVAGGRPLHGLALTYARAGRAAEARAILRRLEELSRTTYVPPDQIALVHAALGETDLAFEWLDNAYRARSGTLLHMKHSPEYDVLRPDPRFAALAGRVGLTTRLRARVEEGRARTGRVASGDPTLELR